MTAIVEFVFGIAIKHFILDSQHDLHVDSLLQPVTTPSHCILLFIFVCLLLLGSWLVLPAVSQKEPSNFHFDGS